MSAVHSHGDRHDVIDANCNVDRYDLSSAEH
jgi:hypothetical protein